MKSLSAKTAAFIAVAVLSLFFLSSCGETDFLKIKGVPLKIQEVSLDSDTIGGNDPLPTDDSGQVIDPLSKNGLNPLFNGILGIPIYSSSMESIPPDPTGNTVMNDYDGDGLTNEEEEAGFTNSFTADYPRITTRISTPITMKLVVDETDETQNHTEMVDDSDTKDTITNSMESRQYNQLNKKTTPYRVSGSMSYSNKNAGSYGYSFGMNTKAEVTVAGTGGSVELGVNTSMNQSFETEMSRSMQSEKTVFEDINYVDNLNRNGVEFKNDTVERISRNYRQSNVSKSNFVINPNAGLVRAALYLKNESLNQPVRINNVLCTLSFRTPSGKCLPVRSFRLRNDDYSEFDEEVYGGEELGPYVLEVTGLNTYEVKSAMANGYVPQIHVVSYDMTRVEDSNYNPGVDNLQVVEETVKGRTALIKITASGVRDMYRVPAFDVDEEGNVTPGISLKKALFNIYRSRLSGGERFDIDAEGDGLTVDNTGLWWKTGYTPPAGSSDPTEYGYGANTQGNKWSKFSTYVKRYVVYERDAAGNVVEREKRIETIDRIGNVKKYNPFSTEDNPAYDPNVPLTYNEIIQMKYWIVLHNGRYYDGDINDPIWAGERYEIVLFDAKDFNEHLETFYYSPLQNVSEQDIGGGSSGSSSGSTQTQYSALQAYSDLYLNTLWNRRVNEVGGEFARAYRLGKVVRGDTIKLQVELDEFRSLFDVDTPGREFNASYTVRDVPGRIWDAFNYTFDEGDPFPEGQPASFTFDAWGGCNQIGLWLQKSMNAHYYTVAIWRQGQQEADAVQVKIDASELDENNGYITINRFSRDTQGNQIGVLEPGDYRIKARAHGRIYNVPVYTVNRANETGILVTSVSDPGGTGLPDFFNVSVYASLNSITVNINQAANAEYYNIDVYGPYNYGHGNGEIDDYTVPRQTFRGHAGINVIEIPDLNAGTVGYQVPLTTEEQGFQVPGVYRVVVSAVNSNIVNPDGSSTGVDPTAANGDPAMAMVSYDPFGNQRTYVPRRQIEEFNPKDVDLEVNFNDGSGWFRLKIAHDDIGDEERTIDCSYTTNFVQNRGLVTIYFTPPTGADGPQNKNYNVFHGGAEEVEVYMRTVAKPEYRDCIWLKPGGRYLDINADVNSLPGYDPLKYWIMNDNTDVNDIDNYTHDGDRVWTSLGELDVDEGDFGVAVPSGKEDFFFSPMKKLTYKISASLCDTDVGQMMSETTHVDNPEYRALGGERSIQVSNIDTQFGISFMAYMRKGRPSGSNEPLGAYPWIPTGEIQTVNANSHSLVFNDYPPVDGEPAEELAPNTEYTICMVAANETSASSRVYAYVKTQPEAEMHALDDAVDANGAGKFINPAVPFTNEMGNVLINGIDFVYGEPLLGGAYDIYDTRNGLEDSGYFEAGKYFRIVSNGVNVADPAGLYLMPLAVDLDSAFATPPADQVYIDPAGARYVLPRPVYWSRCDTHVYTLGSLATITHPDFTPSLAVHGGVIGSNGVYGGCLVQPDAIWGNYDTTGATIIKPFGVSAVDFMQKGTMSAWWKAYANLQNVSIIWLKITDQVYVQGNFGSGQNLLRIIVNQGGVENIVDSVSGLLANDVWCHLYVTWDNEGDLYNGAKINVYVNGSLALTSTAAIIGASIPEVRIGSASNIGNGLVYLDNLKIWDHVVTDGPYAADWEYGAGTRSEEALHPIYGFATGFRPVLYRSPDDGNSDNEGGVGFHCVPQW